MGRGKQSDASNEQTHPSMLFFVAPFLTENHLSAVTATHLLPLAIELNNLKIREFYDEACKATIEAQGKILDVSLGKSKGNKSVDDEKKKFCAYMRELANRKAREFEALMREEVKKKEAEIAAKCSLTPSPWLPPWGSPWYPPPPPAPISAYMPVHPGTVPPLPNWTFSWHSPAPPSTALPESNKNGAAAGKKQSKLAEGGKGRKSKGGRSKANDDSDSDKPMGRKGKRGNADSSDSSSSDSSDDSDDVGYPAQKAKNKGKNQSDLKKKHPGGTKKGDNSQGGGKSVHFSGDDKARSLSSNVNPYVPGAYSVQHGYIRYDCAPGFGAGGQQLAHRYKVYGPSGGLWPDEAVHGGGSDVQVKKGDKSNKGSGKSDADPAWMAWSK